MIDGEVDHAIAAPHDVIVAESMRATKGANTDWLLASGSYPVQIVTKWLMALRLVSQVVLAIEMEKEDAKNVAIAKRKVGRKGSVVEDGEQTFAELFKNAGAV